MDREDLEELHAIERIVKRPRLKRFISKEIEKLEQLDAYNEEVQSSRYVTDYDHKGTLGEGGYGTVLLAQHKLDKKCYAIKLIKIVGKDASSPRIAVREVEIMSSLCHINVVMYHQAWYDSFQDDMYGVGDEREKDEFYALMKGGLRGTTEVNDDDDGSYSASLKSEDAKQRSEESIGGEDDGSYNASVKSEDTKKTEESIEGEDDGSYNASVTSEDSKKRSEENIDGQDARCEHNFVCIQMQVCDRTLHDVLEPNVYQYNREKAIDIFRQIVEGVSYMHEKKIAHNDLNPKNIFFVADTVKIGDFGLATFLSGGESDKEADSSGSSIGVPVYYIAPEGRPANEKVDIYSLGVILFELYHPFGTGSERESELRALKGGTLDSNVATKFPKASCLVKQLMALDPTDRPSTKDLLELHIDTLLED